ncbi:hypothetical protein [Ottowia thiooxydans]|uniref:hypothetical protein n=1 Tax=Ottowia thiooxydans TaxID=219182 RepID=UPI00040F920F|nr:hypothetical protein [Ottowia thiooxydans]
MPKFFAAVILTLIFSTAHAAMVQLTCRDKYEKEDPIVLKIDTTAVEMEVDGRSVSTTEVGNKFIGKRSFAMADLGLDFKKTYSVDRVTMEMRVETTQVRRAASATKTFEYDYVCRRSAAQF